MIRTLVFGAGRMGRCLVELAGDYPDIDIAAQVARTAPESAPAGVPLFRSLEEARGELAGEVQLVLDFTLAEGTITAARWCAEHRVPLLSGVTGVGQEVQAALDRASESTPVLWAANLSVGINLLAGMLRDLGRVIDNTTPVTIEEVHHQGKKDAPSGTALFLARHLRPPAGGTAGTDPRRSAEDFPGIEFVSRRQGEAVGDHSVSFSMRDETLTLAHHAEDRRLYARGALEAGRWLVAQPSGRYSAADWIRSMARNRFSKDQPQA